MSDVKWIKLSVSMFDDEKIRIIESMPEADTILICWIKLLSLAGKTNANGFIFISEAIPYTDEMLAAVFNRPLNTVRMALDMFQKFGMIDVDEQNYISIANWAKHQSVDRLEKIREDTRKRVADHRARKREALQPPKNPSEEYKCAYCGGNGDTLDHIIPRSKGGGDEPKNIVPCCKSCNSSKKDKDVADFLNDSKVYEWQNVDFNLVLKNKRIMDVVAFDGEKFRMKKRYCNVTEMVTVTDIRKEEELEKEIDLIELLEDKKNSPADTPQDHTLFNSSTSSICKDKDNYTKKDDIPYKEIVDYLNERTGKAYKDGSKKTRLLIKARYSEGFTLDDFKRVIDNKVSDWLKNPEMNMYLRPETLFGTKFEGYLNEKPVKPPAPPKPQQKSTMSLLDL